MKYVTNNDHFHYYRRNKSVICQTGQVFEWTNLSDETARCFKFPINYWSLSFGNDPFACIFISYKLVLNMMTVTKTEITLTLIWCTWEFDDVCWILSLLCGMQPRPIHVSCTIDQSRWSIFASKRRHYLVIAPAIGDSNLEYPSISIST